MPSPCFVGDSYPYMQKHNPFIYFNDIRTNSARCGQHVVPYSQMSTDLKSATTTPNYAFITPNMCNDTHDCAVSSGDAWLKRAGALDSWIPRVQNAAFAAGDRVG